jgi:hypothetical protein
MSKRRDPDDPVELHSPGDRLRPLTALEAEVAGITKPVYGDDSSNPNADDKRDSEHAAEDEHF